MAERENNLRETWITGIGIVSCLGEGSTRTGRD
jgi:hypothetical protein